MYFYLECLSLLDTAGLFMHYFKPVFPDWQHPICYTLVSPKSSYVLNQKADLNHIWRDSSISPNITFALWFVSVQLKDAVIGEPKIHWAMPFFCMLSELTLLFYINKGGGTHKNQQNLIHPETEGNDSQDRQNRYINMEEKPGKEQLKVH